MTSAAARATAFRVAAWATILLVAGVSVARLGLHKPEGGHPVWLLDAPLLILAVALLHAPAGPPRPRVKAVRHAVLAALFAFVLLLGPAWADQSLVFRSTSTLLGVSSALAAGAGLHSLLEAVLGRRGRAGLVGTLGVVVALNVGVAAGAQVIYVGNLLNGGLGGAAVAHTFGQVLGLLSDPRMVCWFVVPAACGALPFHLVARQRGLPGSVALAANAAGVAACFALLPNTMDSRLIALPLAAGFAYPLAFALADRVASDAEAATAAADR